jgi:hypothetical protein
MIPYAVVINGGEGLELSEREQAMVTAALELLKLNGVDRALERAEVNRALEERTTGFLYLVFEGALTFYVQVGKTPRVNLGSGNVVVALEG